MFRLFAAAGLIVAGVAAQPATAQVKIGNGNSIVQVGKGPEVWNGAPLCTANCIAAIVSPRGVTIGDGNKITQTRRVDGGQPAVDAKARPDAAVDNPARCSLPGAPATLPERGSDPRVVSQAQGSGPVIQTCR